MLQNRLFTLALASLSVVFVPQARSATFQEDFSSDPAAHGWKTFGNTNLFRWDSTNQNLQVTWDSAQPNSFCYFPLGTILARDDDFTFSFDLLLSDVGTGDTTGPMQLAAGFLNLADATDPGFIRGIGVSPNVVEFDHYPAGYFPGYSSPATTGPAFINSASTAFAPGYLDPYYDLALPTNVLLHVTMAFTASNQTAVVEVRTNGALLSTLPPLVLNSTNNSMFANSDDYRVNIFSITSYSEAGQWPPWVGSVLAHGTIDNLLVTVPNPPVQNLASSFSNGVAQVRFNNRSNWLYTLERTVDVHSWTNVSLATSGNGATLVLQDTNPPPGQGLYRVRANRP
jgi:hypothetical protein